MQRVVKTFQDPQRFSCFLVTNPCSQIAVDTALRYWGCAAQAGVYVAGALYPKLATDTAPLALTIEEGFSPLRISGIPFLSFESPPDWDEVIRRMSQQTKDVLDGRSQAKPIPPPVTFDQSARTITLFLPGFNKSDVKLSQVCVCVCVCEWFQHWSDCIHVVVAIRARWFKVEQQEQGF
jgi:arsenite-transporting ATPase